MSWTILILLVAGLMLAATKLGLLNKRGVGEGDRQRWPVFSKKLLSPVEQQLYQRLVRAFPDHVVLAQVAVSQLVGVKKGNDFQSIYNRFNRLVADFVVANKDFSVAAVLELDDRSHDHPRRQDADQRKAAVLTAAGIPLHRVNVNPLPNESELRSLLTPDYPVLRAVRN